MTGFDPNRPDQFLEQLMRAAIAAADPMVAVPPYLPSPPKGRTVVLGAGKASAAMARAVEENWRGSLEGLIVTRYGYAVSCEQIEIVEAAHPVPDDAGLAAAGRILELANSLGPDDLCLSLISGGASALLTAPADGLTFADKQEVNRQLLRSGATISEMNCLRKHLSKIKGGDLARAISPARSVSLLISDVPGDSPSVIGSGPTVPDETTFDDARQIVAKYQLNLPDAVRDHLNAGSNETPKPGDDVFQSALVEIVARPTASLDAAAEVARGVGIEPIILGDALEGEARVVGKEHAELALEIKNRGRAQSPALILSGGELTVTIEDPNGRGGPNGEYILGMALALDGAEGIHALACDTDGIDGSEDNAGAQIGPDILSRARAGGIDAAKLLAKNDSYGFFEAVDGLVMTGPTYTNVNDFRAVLVLS